MNKAYFKQVIENMDGFQLKLYKSLIELAQKQQNVFVKGSLLSSPPHKLYTSINKLKKETRLKRKRIWTALNYFEVVKLIKRETSNKGSWITLVYMHDFKEKETQKERTGFKATIVYHLYMKDFVKEKIHFMGCYISKISADRDLNEMIQDRPEEDRGKYKFALLISNVDAPVSIELDYGVRWK